MADTWDPPRCEHGFILLGCPHDDCVDQQEMVAETEQKLAEWHERQVLAARALFDAPRLMSDVPPCPKCGSTRVGGSIPIGRDEVTTWCCLDCRETWPR